MSNTNKYFADLIKVCSVLPVFAVAPAMAETHPDGLVIDAGTVETIATGDQEIYAGSLSGGGVLLVKPNADAANTTVVIEGSIKDFNGAFQTHTSGNAPAGSGFLVLKNWADGQEIVLNGTEWTDKGGVKKENMGTVEFAGHNKVKLVAVRQHKDGGYGNIYLMDNELDRTSVVEGHNLYLGARGGVDNGRDVELEGYMGTKTAKLFISGTNSSIVGDLRAEVEDSAFGMIAGMANKVGMTGNIVLDVERVDADSVYGQYNANGDSNSMLNGNIFINVEDSDIGNVIGQYLKASGDVLSGINGNININVENSKVNMVSGVSFNSVDAKWLSTMYNAADNINIRVKDSVVTSELLATGAYPSVGNVKIDVLGNTVIGYTDKTANTVNEGEDGWIIAGAQRPGARIESAEINLNTAGVIKIAGAINAGSREKADANTADIDSTGRTTLNMFGGGNVFVGGDVRAYRVAGDSVLNLDNITVDIAQTLKEFKEINIGDDVLLTVNNLEFAEKSVLNILLKSADNYSKLVAENVSGAGNANVNLLVASAGKYTDVLSGVTFEEFADVSYSNKVFDIAASGGDVTASVRSVDDIVANTGMSAISAGAVSAFASSSDANLQAVSLAVQEALNNGDVALVEKEMAKVNPDSKPVGQFVASSVQGQVVSVAAGRMSVVGGGATGRSGGDVSGAGFWAQGLVNKSKMGGAFKGHTTGFALGGDTLIDDVFTLGGGFAFNGTEIDADGRDTSVESNSVFAYAQYKPSKWYANATFSYTMSDYTDDARVFDGAVINNQYDTKAFGAQAMFGYDFASGVTPEVGLRYLYVSQEEHVDGLNRVIKEMNSDVLTGIAGLNYAFAIESDTAVKFSPSLRAAMTYDIMTPDAVATIVVPGAAPYYVDVDSLSRLGGEFGIGLTAEYRGLELSLNYELDLHDNYTSQTGLFKFRYDF